MRDPLPGPDISAPGQLSTTAWVAAVACLAWYATVASVCLLGHVLILRHYSRPPPPAQLINEPHVTIIRPVKGPEPYLYACLASTFQQSYPKSKIHVRFCVASRADPSLPVLEQLCRDFPDHDATILVEDEDDELRSGRLKLGPNPKIRNMSRAYREAGRASDIAWIIDCNVWVGRHTLARMLALAHDFKYVHLMPTTVDISAPGHEDATPTMEMSGFGGRVDEMYLSTHHAKFYAAINTVAVAPCVVGKSTMFRIAHLDAITDGAGIDPFSENICEDQLIGMLLWQRRVPEETQSGPKRRALGKHALCFGDLAVQPVSMNSLAHYCGRRVRWLRARKFTVMLATLVEPGTESLVGSLFGAYAFAALSPLQYTRAAFAGFWLLSVATWCLMDWCVYTTLQSNRSVHVDGDTPPFATPGAGNRRTFGDFLRAWSTREALALPIWTVALCGGSQIDWRGKYFSVGRDMKVHEVREDGSVGNRDWLSAYRCQSFGERHERKTR